MRCSGSALRRASLRLLLTLWLAASGCTRDFSAFRFDDSGSERDDSAASGAGRGGAGSGGAPADAQAEGGPIGGQGGGDSGAAGRGGMGAGGAPDSSAGNGGSDDAGADEPDVDAEVESAGLQCETRWNEDLGVSPACRECSCDRCAQPVIDCVTLGDERERQLCETVFLCAMENACQDYSCYCATTGCNNPSASGDGPCAQAMDQAAGGNRAEVDKLRGADPPDYEQPLMRAVRAIGCVLGVHTMSPGPSEPGQCTDACPMRN
jgi:hypothetical protein